MYLFQYPSALNLSITHLKSKKYAEQLTTFSLSHKIQWIIMGSRKDDPGCSSLSQLAKSDTHKGYPQFLRVNPIIQWSYSFVWDVIKQLCIPYCELYENGYTSLGNKVNTVKNQGLKVEREGREEYLPAHMADGEEERKNRKQ